MSIYDENKVSFPSVTFSFKKFKYPILAIAAILVVVIAVFTVSEMLKPKVLSVSIQPNPLDLAMEPISSAFINAVVSNNTGSELLDITVEPKEVGSSALIIFPSYRAIESIADKTNRIKLDAFVVRPNPAKEIDSGSYRISVSLYAQGKKLAEEEVTLVIKAI